MSDGRKRLSGAQYKALAEEKRRKIQAVLDKTQNLKNYFLTKPTNSQEQTDCSESEDLEVVSVVPIPIPPDNAVNAEAVDTVTEASSSSNVESACPSPCLPAIVSNDPADWNINDDTINYLMSLPNEICQNTDEDFSLTKIVNGGKSRCLTKNVFRRKLANGEEQPRKYLIYSSSKKSLFCIPCRLFGGTSKMATEGINDWSNVNKILNLHENSKEHAKSQVTLLRRRQKQNQIDSLLCQQISIEEDYWRNVLKRVVAVTKKLASRGLPFRGTVEKFGNTNNGNFMMCLELIAEFDPFLATHLSQHGNPGSGKTSYLSSTICEEFIDLMSTEVLNHIMTEIRMSKYYSIIIDSTPDMAHIDQLSVIIRYVTNNGKPVERFIGFLPNVGHKSEDLENAIMSKLEKHNLELKHCRGQSYDNASNMSGCYSGLQARILNHNPLAYYLPCAAHSLNLVGVCAAECTREAVRFFETIQNLYTFFSASTRRWEILLSSLKPGAKVPKRVDGTRWSARHDALMSLCGGWGDYLNALTTIEESISEKPTVRAEAAGIKRCLNRFEFAFMSVFWEAILERFHSTNKILQSVEIDNGDVTRLFSSLISFVKALRNTTMFETYLDKAKEIMDESYDNDRQRTRRRKLFPDENMDGDTILTGKEQLKVETYFSILDRVMVELEKRYEAYDSVFKKFKFFFTLKESSQEQLIESANYLQQCYKDDLEDVFATECLHFAELLKETDTKHEKCTLSNMLSYIRSHNLEAVFPNVEIALRMFVTMAVTVCSAERSFSTLKRLKTYLRTTMQQNRLNALTILTIESDITIKLDFDSLINSFASIKSRRKII
ncbi:zinc finger MYM-type protein 1-like [Photinus pyralis]|nr:zinc finger MYM-type protein 1-like [Photinus pyralis]